MIIDKITFWTSQMWKTFLLKPSEKFLVRPFLVVNAVSVPFLHISLIVTPPFQCKVAANWIAE
jgi:hypothetical protein